MNGDSGVSAVLDTFEVENVVHQLNIVDIEQVGDSNWLTLHEQVEKLLTQATFEAQTNREEHTRQLLLDSGKVPLLVADLIVSELWRCRVLPLLLTPASHTASSPLLYMVLYHELSVLSLLALVIFEPARPADSAESPCGVRIANVTVDSEPPASIVGDVLLDLIDYCHRCVACTQAAACSSDDVANRDGAGSTDQTAAADTGLWLHRARPSSTDEAPRDFVAELLWQRDQLQLQASQQAVAILYYLGEQLARLPIAAASRLLRVHDTPLVLASLLEHPPWLRDADHRRHRENSGEGTLVRQKLEQRRWLNCPDDGDAFTSADGQCWLLLARLLLGGQQASFYQLHEARCRRLLRLQPLLTDQLLRRLPVLQLLNQWLMRLSAGQLVGHSAKPPPVIETVPQLWPRLAARSADSWRRMAERQARRQFGCDPGQLRSQAERLARLYDLDKMAALLPEQQKCGQCGGEAVKRCAGCRQVWYCGRRCQSQHWPQHRSQCSFSASN